MAQNLDYMAEEEIGVGRPSNERLAIECTIVAALCFLALKFGGFHKGGNPLGEVIEMNYLSASVITAVVTMLFLGARLWRVQHSPEHHDGVTD